MRRILPAILLLLSTLTLQAQNLKPDEVQVRGRLIDVRTVEKKENFYPQYQDSKFDDILLEQLGEGRCYAVSLAERRGPEQVRCGRAERCIIALDYGGDMPKGWEETGETFDVCGVTYHMYEYRRVKTGEWIDIPYPDGCTRSAVVFGTKVSVADVPEFGTVICKVKELRKKGAYNQTMTILPDGSYLAACSMGEAAGPQMFISRDKGKTWQPHGKFTEARNKVSNYHNLFVHNGDIYFMGVGPNREGLRISRSTDGGINWSSPVDSKSGIILKGKYHTAPVPVLISAGRIWRACETYPDKNPFMLSAPADCDLLDASNWTRTNTVGPAAKTVDGRKMSGSIIEGNAVEAPDGTVVNLIRTNSTRTSNYATILHTKGLDSLYFDPATDWVRMPGGGLKFTVRFDHESKMYWALTNTNDESEEHNHLGLGYKVGISHSLMRNKLVLICSPDLKKWKICETVLHDPDPFFHGFQYADWVFDGNDMVGVVRVGAPESRGLPVRQHDSNMMVFIRVENFRQYR